MAEAACGVCFAASRWIPQMSSGVGRISRTGRAQSQGGRLPETLLEPAYVLDWYDKSI